MDGQDEWDFYGELPLGDVHNVCYLNDAKTPYKTSRSSMFIFLFLWYGPDVSETDRVVVIL
jgi:hypothetical protein